jgi:hypothetical protein
MNIGLVKKGIPVPDKVTAIKDCIRGTKHIQPIKKMAATDFMPTDQPA